MRRTAAALTAVALGLTACAQGSSGGGGGDAVRLVGNVRTVNAGSLSAADVGAAQRAFGLDVLKALCAKADTANKTLSPSSLADVLALIDAGSAGSTRASMAKLLHLPAWGDDVVAAERARTAALKALAADKAARVVISNHVWAQAGAAPTQHYLDDVRTAFDADLRTVDFARHVADATDAINASVKHDTDGMIKKLFDDPLDPSTVDVLTNAVALDAKWARPFDPDSPMAPFTTATGSSVQVRMMSSSEDTYAWTSADGWQAATLPYQGGKISAVAVLPPKGTTTCATPSADALTALLGRARGTATVHLPRLQLEQSHSLLKMLTDLGLPANGDFSGIYPGAFISTVIQKVLIHVDEKGTKAAAATGGGMATSLIQAPHDLTFDRPFLFLIRDTATGSPLFLTWVGDPTQP
jgi:serpin B